MRGKKNVLKRHRILIIFFMVLTMFSNMLLSVAQATDEGGVTSTQQSSSQTIVGTSTETTTGTSIGTSAETTTGTSTGTSNETTTGTSIGTSTEATTGTSIAISATTGTAISIELTYNSMIVNLGGSRQIKAVVKDKDGNPIENQTITWSSEKTDIGTVDSTGLVTGKKVGTTTITAKCNEISAQCQIKVIDGYATNLVIITGTTTSWVPLLVEGYHNLIEKRNPPYNFGLKIFSDTDLESNTDKVQQAVENADAIVIEMIADARTETLHTIFSNCWNTKWKDGKKPAIFTDGCTKGFGENIVKDLSLTVNKNQDDLAAITTYIKSNGSDNSERLLLFLASKYGEGDVTTTEDLTPIGGRGTFAYHPNATGSGIFLNPEDYYKWYESRPEYNPSAPWVGIMDFDSSYNGGDHDLTTELVKSLEKKGNNVVLIFTPSGKKFESVRSFFYRDLDGDGQKEPAIDTFICPMGFQFDSDTPKTTALFKEMNVPVLAPIYSTDLKKWVDDPAGISSNLYSNVAMPELDGRIEPVLLGGTETLAADEATGAVIQKRVAIPDRIDRAAGRASSWAKLHKMQNKDKKIAIVYYNTEGGKDGIGCTTLNVPKSLTEVLNAMKNKNYTVDQDGALSTAGKIDEDKLFNAIFDKGRNIGGWAPGELAKFASQDGIIKVSLDEYLSWYNQLPAELRAAVEKEWGPAPGKLMVQDGQIIIPGIMSGNIFLGPQPMRGWGEDADKIAHSPTLPPSHQYIAFYLWLQHEYKADAVVHFGTHGTLEWLPGKSVGLSGEDWSDVLIGDMPNIYPYVVNNPGEGTQAKRRSYAVLIDYLTAAMTNTDLYGNLRDLDDLNNQYTDAVAKKLPTEDIDKIKTKIKTILIDEKVGEKIGVTADDLDKNFDSALQKCEEYLKDLESGVTQLGLHTFGVAPQGEDLEAMIKAIVNYDPETRSALIDEIRANLQNTTQEMDMFLLALNAGHIPPGPGHDPIRDPGAMPTGKNIVSFDPRKTPDTTSWAIGKKCADELVANYYAQHGSYPESVGVVLWAIETMRDGGQGIAMIMRLMGIEPVWDSTGKVTGYKVTPLSELGRPRIDVVVTASSLFRDTFSNVMTLLDKAARELAISSEDGGNNYIKKHYDTLKSQYLSQGKSEDDAEFLAASRVYSAPPGTQGNGVAEKLGATDSWTTSNDVVETYINRASYIYGTDKNGKAVYGQEGKDAFVNVLKNVDATVHVIDSTYGALDNDDVAGDLGGLTIAAKWASGKDVDTYIANTRLGLNGSKVQTIQQFVSQELDSNLLNPTFVEAMLKEGYAGSSTLAKWIGNTFFVDSTMNAVSDEAWHNLAATYIFNDEVRSKLDPYCLQSMIGWQMQAAEKGMWNASKEDLTKLSDTYIQTMVDYGVVCCHHTCKDIVANEWIAQFSTLDDQTLKKFANTLTDATHKDVKIATTENNQTNTNPSSSSSSNTNKNTTTSNTNTTTTTTNKNIDVNVSTNTSTDNSSPTEKSNEASGKTEDQKLIASNDTTTAANGQGETNSENQSSKPETTAAASAGTAGNLPAAKDQQQQNNKEAEKQDSTANQNTAGGQKGKTQKSKAVEIDKEGKAQKASGVNIWAILSVIGVMAAVVLGIIKGKKMSQ